MTQKRTQIWVPAPLRHLKRGANVFIFLLAVLLVSLSPFFATPKIPTSDQPFQVYSNQTEQNLEKTVLEYIQQAKIKIVLSTFGEVDSRVLDALEKRAHEGIEVILHYDAKTFPDFPKRPLSFQVIGHKPQGLMHQKILAIDDQKIILGSTNLTKSSFKLHDNLLIGIFSPDLTQKIIDQLTQPKYPFVIEETFQDAHLSFWSLPGLGKPALSALLDAINRAESTVDCMIFTFTHQKIVSALSAAIRRGVKVTLTVDRKTVKGSSKEAIEALRKIGAVIYINNHKGLMHHKMGWIDREKFFFGSANWTKSAFEKNRDYLVLLEDLSPALKENLEKLYQGGEKNRKLYRVN
ncbi:MAG: phospholipase D-like domain-containing protein [Chlamydiia bacterium]